MFWLITDYTLKIEKKTQYTWKNYLILKVEWNVDN